MEQWAGIFLNGCGKLKACYFTCKVRTFFFHVCNLMLIYTESHVSFPWWMRLGRSFHRSAELAFASVTLRICWCTVAVRAGPALLVLCGRTSFLRKVRVQSWSVDTWSFLEVNPFLLKCLCKWELIRPLLLFSLRNAPGSCGQSEVSLMEKWCLPLPLPSLFLCWSLSPLFVPCTPLCWDKHFSVHFFLP